MDGFGITRRFATGQLFKGPFYGYNHATCVPCCKPWNLEAANEK
jgi:hypothetical protein